jgi:hypothetical protein
MIIIDDPLIKEFLQNRNIKPKHKEIISMIYQITAKQQRESI